MGRKDRPGPVLTASYTLAEIQKFAQVPPGQVLVLPPPDSEAPDDLFPEEVTGSKPGVRLEDGVTERDFMTLWDRTKRKVWQLDIREHQLKQWFEKHCHINVDMDDFNWPLPPAKFTAEGLSRFLKAVDRDAAC